MGERQKMRTCDLCQRNITQIKAKYDLSHFAPNEIWHQLESACFNHTICCICYDIILGLTVDLGYVAEDELEERGLSPMKHRK